MDTLAPGTPRSAALGTGEAARVLEELITFKARAADTGGAYTLCEIRTPPGGGVPAHRLLCEEQSFYVLEGTFEFRIGDDTVRFGPGGYVFVPRGSVNAFSNVGTAPARMLLLVTPGGIHEEFFLEIGTPAAGPAPHEPPDLGRLMSAAAKYGVELLPPPMA